MTNTSSRDISLWCKTNVDSLHSVKSVFPVVDSEMTPVNSLEGNHSLRHSNWEKGQWWSIVATTCRHRTWLHSRTTRADQETLVWGIRSILKEWWWNRKGNLTLEIRLKDHEPIHQSYIAIPPPLYKEVKEYLHDPAEFHQEKSIIIFKCHGVCQKTRWILMSMHRQQEAQPEADQRLEADP